MLRDFVRHLQHELGQEILKVQGELGSGLAKDHAEYKQQVGMIRGLKRAQDVAGELLKKGTDNEEDDD